MYNRGKSIRRFLPDPVTDEMVARLLEAGRLAPSRANSQPWCFVVIRDAEVKRELHEAVYRQDIVVEAPVLIAVLGVIDPRASVPARTLELVQAGAFGMDVKVFADHVLDNWNEHELITDSALNAAIAGTHVVLAAHAFGLGCCWIKLCDDQKEHLETLVAERTARIEELNVAIAQSIDGIILNEFDGSIKFVNDAWANMHGCSVDELIGKHLQIFHTKEQLEKEVAPALERLRANGSFEGEIGHLRRDGTLFPTYMTASIVRNAEGASYGMLAVARDITDRKRAEEALRLKEERFRNAFEFSAIGMALVSPDGSWLKVNRRICEIVGYTEDELVQMTFQDITHPDDLDADVEFVRQMLAGDIETYHMEKRYLHKDGHVVWVLLAVSLVRDGGGAPLHFISQVADITALRQAEAALRESESRFRMVLEGSSIVVASVDRELRYNFSRRSSRDGALACRRCRGSCAATRDSSRSTASLARDRPSKSSYRPRESPRNCQTATAARTAGREVAPCCWWTTASRK